MYAIRSYYGFLAVDVLAVASGECADVRVPVVGRGDHDRVDVFADTDLAEILDHQAVAVAVLVIDTLLGRFV